MQHIHDFWGDPLTAAAAESADGKAVFVQLNLTGSLGETSGNESAEAVQDIVDRTPPPPGVKAYVTGPAPLAADLGKSGNSTVIQITAVSMAVIFIMLLLVFRSIITAIVLLLMVGIQLQVARGIVAFLGDHEIVGLTTYVVNLLVSRRDRGWNGLRDILLRSVSRGTSSRRGSGNGLLHHLPRGREGCLGVRSDYRRSNFLPQLYSAALFPTPGHPGRGGHVRRGRGGPHAGSGDVCRRQPLWAIRAQAAVSRLVGGDG